MRISIPKLAVRNCWCAASIAAVAIALLAVLAVPASEKASAGPQCPFTIDFAGLPAGTILGEQYASRGVHISGVANEGFPDKLIVFDTNAPPTHDPDLAVNIGNIAIFARNLTDANGDGLVDDPDENNFGGTATFAFDQDVTIGSVLWIDKDHNNPNFVVASDAAGNVIKSVPVPLGANASVQKIAINADGVRKLQFVYHESGGFSGIEVDCAQSTPTPTSTAPAATPTQSPSPVPTAAAAVSPPSAGTSVSALPATGGAPPASEPSTWWAALALPASVLGGTAFWMRRRMR